MRVLRIARVCALALVFSLISPSVSGPGAGAAAAEPTHPRAPERIVAPDRTSTMRVRRYGRFAPVGTGRFVNTSRRKANTGFEPARRNGQARIVTGVPHAKTARGRRFMAGRPGVKLGTPRRAHTGLPDSHARRGKRVAVIPQSVRVVRFGRPYGQKRSHKKRFPHLRGRHGVRVHFARFGAFALPEQTLFPPYYHAEEPWARGPDMKGRFKGDPTVEQGSRYASHIKGGLTVRQGSRYASHIAGGKTDRQGSPFRSRIAPGRTVRQGSPWGSKIGNWRFSGTQSPMRPAGIPYYRSR